MATWTSRSVLRAVPANPAGADLAPLAHKAPKKADVLVVNPLRVLLAEEADLLLAPRTSLFGGALGIAVAVVCACHGC